MDQVDGLSKDYLTAIAAYAVVMVVVACYIIFDERIPQEPNLVRTLLCEAHMHQLFFGGRTNTYDYLRMDRGSFFNLARTLRNGGSLRDTLHLYRRATRNVPSHYGTQCQE